MTNKQTEVCRVEHDTVFMDQSVTVAKAHGCLISLLAREASPGPDRKHIFFDQTQQIHRRIPQSPADEVVAEFDSHGTVQLKSCFPFVLFIFARAIILDEKL